ncbi:FmdB family transcriptional regulator [Knoellia sinensis KCTC 19936]|uniref:FmdB family transcriptional regulator n=1 Tax=Knoellia sinensis KCTC 19936 TaxID=1385520 RepID=A0A0A0J246_9MICO|nr:FmdB family zinc ribbon protein [Knoellia sinensis]KGN30222.1 FmdB family transcriptional regulator [Knoellia sinensis KCTC 19936]
MPTYAYACRDCDHRFEAVQSFSDDSLSICPECDGSLRKVFNSVGVVFKGGGFYRTDSRSASSSSTPASPSSDSSSSSSTTSSSTTSTAAASA